MRLYRKTPEEKGIEKVATTEVRAIWYVEIERQTYINLCIL